MLYRRYLFSVFPLLLFMAPPMGANQSGASAQEPKPVPAEERGWLGLGYCFHEEADPNSKHQTWLSVDGLAPGGPAEKAGFETGDLIVGVAKITGSHRSPVRLTGEAQILEFFRGVGRGDVLEFSVLRFQSEKEIEVTAAAAPARGPAEGSRSRLGDADN